MNLQRIIILCFCALLCSCVTKQPKLVRLDMPPLPPGYAESKAMAAVIIPPATQRFDLRWDYWTEGVDSSIATSIVLRHSTNLVTWEVWSLPKTATNATAVVVGAPAHFFNIGYSLVP